MTADTMTVNDNTGTDPPPRSHLARRRITLATMFGAITITLALFAAPSMAGAATTTISPYKNAGAFNYGFNCNGAFPYTPPRAGTPYGYVHQNWPNIYVQSAQLQNVYVRSFLRKYNFTLRKWVPVVGATVYGAGVTDANGASRWFVGVSNIYGRHQLGNTASYPFISYIPWWRIGMQPYYFAIAGYPSLVPPNIGYSFIHLSHGWYTTVEQYYAGGHYWNSQSHYQDYGINPNSPTSCYA